MLQNVLEYGPRLRPAAEAMFHLDDRPAVEAVATGSPAARAGLRADDILLAIDDQPLPASAAARRPAPTPGRRPTRRSTAAQARIAEALRRGAAPITVQRGGATLRLELAGQPGCAYDAQVMPGPAWTPRRTGGTCSSRLRWSSYADTDARLALVLGHEYAHDVLHHHRRLDAGRLRPRVLGNLGSTPASLRLAEKEADYVGLYLTARAGYDISAAPDFWRRFPAADGDLDWTHPGIAERAASAWPRRATRSTRKRAAGQPLLPRTCQRQAAAADAEAPTSHGRTAPGRRRGFVAEAEFVSSRRRALAGSTSGRSWVKPQTISADEAAPPPMSRKQQLVAAEPLDLAARVARGADAVAKVHDSAIGGCGLTCDEHRTDRSRDEILPHHLNLCLRADTLGIPGISK